MYVRPHLFQQASFVVKLEFLSQIWLAHNFVFIANRFSLFFYHLEQNQKRCFFLRYFKDGLANVIICCIGALV